MTEGLAQIGSQIGQGVEYALYALAEQLAGMRDNDGYRDERDDEGQGFGSFSKWLTYYVKKQRAQGYDHIKTGDLLDRLSHVLWFSDLGLGLQELAFLGRRTVQTLLEETIQSDPVAQAQAVQNALAEKQTFGELFLPNTRPAEKIQPVLHVEAVSPTEDRVTGITLVISGVPYKNRFEYHKVRWLAKRLKAEIDRKFNQYDEERQYAPGGSHHSD